VLRPGVARGRDVAVLDAHHAGAMPGCDLRRAIGGSVVHDDDFNGFLQCERGDVEGVQRGRDQTRFVMGRDDEGDHPPIMAGQ